MNRVAIRLSGAAPVDRDAICAAFREVHQSGGRVVVLTHDGGSSDDTLHQLLHRLGDDFDQLFTLAGDEFYEWIVEDEHRPQLATGTLH